MSSIFITHSDRDRGLANQLAGRLRAQGYEALFLDFDPDDGIPTGRLWERELQHALRRCRALIALCTRSSMSSRWCFAEIVLAKTLGCEIFPLQAEPCEIDPVLCDHQVLDLTAGEEAYGRLFEGLRRAGLDARSSFRWDSTRSPFPGLEPFSALDVAVFFGRGPEIDGVLAELRRMARGFEDSRLCVLVGASGTGKSSLLLAGVLPRVTRDSLPLVIVPPFRPRGKPLQELGLALDTLFLDPFVELRDGALATVWNPLRERLLAAVPPDEDDARTLAALLRRLLTVRQQPEASFLLVVDQLEEAFGSSDVAAFFALLRGLLADSARPLIALATMRASSLERYQEQAAGCSLPYRMIPIDPLSSVRYTEVILRPAAMIPLSLEPGLGERLVLDAAREGALPLLAFTLQRMYRLTGRPGEVWTAALYEAVGGIGGSIEQTVKSLLLRPEDEAVLRRCFLRLFRLDDNGRWLRRPLPRSDLPPEAHPLIERLVNERLLVESAGHVEVAHEALSRVWPALHGWLEADRDFQGMLLRLDAAIEDWRRNGRDDGWLLQGLRLDEAERWLGSRCGDLTPGQQVFIKAGLGERDRLRDAERRRELAAAAAEASAAVARRRVRAHRLTLDLKALSSDRPQLALLLAIEAVEAVREDGLDPATEQALRDALDGCAGIGLSGHREALTSVAVSADGQRVLTGSYDATARLWDAASPEPWASAVVLEHPARVSVVAVSPDGRRIATGDAKGTVRLWDIGTDGVPGEARVCAAHKLEVRHLRFSADGFWLASGGEDALACVWRADVDRPALRLSGHADYFHGRRSTRVSGTALGERDFHNTKGGAFGYCLGISALAWQADGQSLATGGDDGKLIVWRLGREEVTEEQLHSGEGKIVALAFSRDGTLFAAVRPLVGDSQVLALAAGRRPPLSLLFTVEGSNVNALSLSTDERWLAAGGGDTLVKKKEGNSVYLADLLPGGEGLRRPAIRHERQPWAVVGVGFSSDGRTLAVVDQGGGVWSCDLNRPDPLLAPARDYGHDRHEDQSIAACAFASGRAIVCTAGADRTARVVEIAPPGAVPRHSQVGLRGHKRSIGFLAFTPDGQRLVTTATAGDYLDKDPPAVWTLPAAGGPLAPPVSLVGHSGIKGTALCPNGRRLATASAGTVHLWDLDSEPPGRSRVLHGPEKGPERVAFSADGRWLIAARAAPWWPPPGLHLWDLGGEFGEDGEPVFTLPETRLLCMAEDHRAIATLEGDTIEIWDLAAAVLPTRTALTLARPAPITWAFSPDGCWLAGGGEGGAVQVWDLRARSRGEVWSLGGRHRKAPTRIVFSRDSRRLIALPDRGDGPLPVWSLAAEGWIAEGVALTGQKERGYNGDVAATSRWLVTVWGDKTARLWDLAAEDPFRGSIILHGHLDSVTRLAVSHDERRLATADRTGEIRLWDLSAEMPSETSVILRNQKREVTALVFAPDDRWLGVGGSDGVVRLFRVELSELIAAARRAVGRNLTPFEWERYFSGRPYRETFPGLP